MVNQFLKLQLALILTWYHGRTQGGGGVGVKKTFELDVLQNYITCATEIDCFRILFAC